MNDTEIPIIGVNTYMEHDEIRDRLRKHCDQVLIPIMKPFDIKAKYGSPCFSKIQDEFIRRYQDGKRTKSTMKRVLGTEKFNLNKKARNLLLSGDLHKVSPLCCKFLKKEPLRIYEKQSGRKPIMGIRTTESKMRKAQYKSCFTKDGKFNPIHDLSDELINKIYKTYNIEIPEVYNHITRTGCMGCPYGSYKGDTEKELNLISDKKRNFVIEYFKESYEVLGINIDKQLSIDDYLDE